MTRDEFAALMIPIMEQSEPNVFIRHMTGFLFSFVAADVMRNKDYDNEKMGHVEIATHYGSVHFIIDFEELIKATK